MVKEVYISWTIKGKVKIIVLSLYLTRANHIAIDFPYSPNLFIDTIVFPCLLIY